MRNSKMKFLVLGGYASNKELSKIITDTIIHTQIDFTYVDPIYPTHHTADMVNVNEAKSIVYTEGYCWYYLPAFETPKPKWMDLIESWIPEKIKEVSDQDASWLLYFVHYGEKNKKEAEEMAESIRQIREIIIKEKIDGVLCLCQGGAIGKHVMDLVKCAVFIMAICGEDPEIVPDIPTLHIIGRYDPGVNIALDWAKRCKDSEIHIHERAHQIPYDWESIEILNSFLSRHIQ
jgi:hypothetical protein